MFIKDENLVSKVKREDVIENDSAPYYFAPIRHPGSCRRNVAPRHARARLARGPPRARARRAPAAARGLRGCVFSTGSARTSAVSPRAIGVPATRTARVAFFYALTPDGRPPARSPRLPSERRPRDDAEERPG